MTSRIPPRDGDRKSYWLLTVKKCYENLNVPPVLNHPVRAKSSRLIPTASRTIATVPPGIDPYRARSRALGWRRKILLFPERPATVIFDVSSLETRLGRYKSDGNLYAHSRKASRPRGENINSH
ncbi:unnamed protein product, partial [Iphiclides podalirius]